MTKHSVAWRSIAWRHPAVGLRSVSFEVKSALCRVTVSTPPSLLHRALCFSHSSIFLSAELMWHLAQWHSDIFCWYFFSAAPWEKHTESHFVSFSSLCSFFDQGQTQHQANDLYSKWPATPNALRYVTRYIRRKGINRVMSNSQKKKKKKGIRSSIGPKR